MKGGRMTKGIVGIAEVTAVYDNRVDFNVEAAGYKDVFTVWFDQRIDQEVLGLERLFGCRVGNQFAVTVEIVPPGTSTQTHLVVTAFGLPIV